MTGREGMDRRSFLAGMLKGAAASAVGGVVWGGLVAGMDRAPLVLRPPGALAADNFPATCIRCGRCVAACPYDTLELATPGRPGPVGMPAFTPRKTPCYLCQDIPCTAACPSGALDPSSVCDETGAPDITRARMGVAVIDYTNCIAAWGLRCDVCYRVCPLVDKAILLEMTRNERTGRHARLVPRIDPEHCTGCGLCEHACVVEKAAVFVQPREVALGRVGDQYIRGWDRADERRLRQDAVQPPEGDPLDYLNGGGLDDE